MTKAKSTKLGCWNFKHYLTERYIELRRDSNRYDLAGQTCITVARFKDHPIYEYAHRNNLIRKELKYKDDDIVIVYGQNARTGWTLDELTEMQVAVKKAVELLEVVEKIL